MSNVAFNSPTVPSFTSVGNWPGLFKQGDEHPGYILPLSFSQGENKNLVSSWISFPASFTYGKQTESSVFEQIWKHRPNESQTLYVYNNAYKPGRRFRDFGNVQKGYRFSGQAGEVYPVPDCLLPFVLKGEELLDEDKISGDTLTLVNWYRQPTHDACDVIGSHSDAEKELSRDINGGTSVVSFTLQETIGPGNSYRIFRIKPKKGGKNRLDLKMTDGMVLVMKGQMQKEFKHAVPPVPKSHIADTSFSNSNSNNIPKVGRRINITVRRFKNKSSE